MVEEVRDGVPVVGEVLFIGGFEVFVDVLALHKQQRQSIDEAHDVGAPAVEIAPHPQLAHAQEVVVLRRFEIKDPQPFPHPLAIVVAAEGDLYAVADQVVLLAIGGDDGLRGNRGGNLPQRVVVGVVCGSPGFSSTSFSRSVRVSTPSRSDARSSRLFGPKSSLL